MIDLKKHTVLAGQIVITSAPSLISTVLGSCVAVCLWDRMKHLGGMNHYLLPGNDQDTADNANRGLPATRLLINSFINRQSRIENMEAKVFGGCNSLYRGNDLFKIGERNIAIALQVLDDCNIPVIAQHVGGIYGRKIVFNTDTGKVRLRLLNTSINDINDAINKGFSY